MADFQDFLKRLTKPGAFNFYDNSEEPEYQVPETPTPLNPDYNQDEMDKSLFDRVSNKISEKNMQPQDQSPVSMSELSQRVSNLQNNQNAIQSSTQPQVPTSLEQSSPYNNSTSQSPKTYKDDSVDMLKKAQEAANAGSLANELGRAGEIIGSGISRTKPVAQDIFNKQIEESKQGVKNAQDLIEQKDKSRQRLVEMEANDASSETSKMIRDQLESITGVKVPDNMSAAQASKTLGINLGTLLNAQENRRARVESAQIRKEDMGLRREELKANRDKDRDIRYGEKFNTALNKFEKEKQDTNANIDAAFQLAQQATESPTAAANLARTVVKAVEGSGARVSDKDAQTALRAGGVSEDAIAKLGQWQKGTIPKFQANDVQKMLKTIKQFSDKKFQDREDQMVFRQAKLVDKNESDIRDSSFIPKKEQANSKSIQSTLIGPSEEKRMTKDGKVAIFDKNTKEFLRYE